MNTAQKVVLFVGVLLLALNFTFPCSSYWTSYNRRELPSDDRATVTVTFTLGKKLGFLPIWTALAQREKQKVELKADPSRDTYRDTIIHWPLVFSLAAFIVVLCAWSFRSLGRKGKPGSHESPITHEGA